MSKFISSANASIKVVDDANQEYNIDGWVKLK